MKMPYRSEWDKEELERISKEWEERSKMPKLKTGADVLQSFANVIFDKIIEAVEASVYQYTIDSDVCGSGCCSEKVELIDVDEFKRILREATTNEKDDR